MSLAWSFPLSLPFLLACISRTSVTESKISGLLLCKLWAKEKSCGNVDHHWCKKCSFFSMQTNWVGPSGAQRFCKNCYDSSLESLIVTRVESFCEIYDSGRVTNFSTWLESCLRHQKSRLGSSLCHEKLWLESSHTITRISHRQKCYFRSWASAGNFQVRGKVDILLIVFTLLTRQCKWTLRKPLCPFYITNKCAMLLQHYQKMRFVSSYFSFFIHDSFHTV